MYRYSIQSSLESNDKIEVEAAVFAMDSFCELSRLRRWASINYVQAALFDVYFSVFAEGVYLKMADMVLGNKYYQKRTREG